mmetsp:Transcript_4258/g.6704  ORF Transcript_4258/g.6704 Transcript_4258/m.6704 type:complete len:430 (-) Transcript_4258:93-1382(-)
MSFIQIAPTQEEVTNYLGKRGGVVIHDQPGAEKSIFISYRRPKAAKDDIRHIRCATDDYKCLSDAIFEANIQDLNVVYKTIAKDGRPCRPLSVCAFGNCNRSRLCYAPVSDGSSFRFCNSACKSCYCSSHANQMFVTVSADLLQGPSADVLSGTSSKKQGKDVIHILRVPFIHAATACAFRYAQWFCGSSLCRRKFSHYLAFDVDSAKWVVKELGAMEASPPTSRSGQGESSNQDDDDDGATGNLFLQRQRKQADLAARPHVFVVYSQRGCGWCVRAENCLRSYRRPFTVVPVTQELAKKMNIVETPTVFQVFDRGSQNERSFRIGGFVELERLLKSYDFLNAVTYWKQVPTFKEVYNVNKFTQWSFCGTGFTCSKTAANLAQIAYLQKKGLLPKSDKHWGVSSSPGRLNVPLEAIVRIIQQAESKAKK